MHRTGLMSALVFLALGFAVALPATAGDAADLQKEVAQLRQQLEALSAQQATMLEDEIDSWSTGMSISISTCR